MPPSSSRCRRRWSELFHLVIARSTATNTWSLRGAKRRTPRHCEEQSDEAIHASLSRRDGLLRYARNDAEGFRTASRQRVVEVLPFWVQRFDEGKFLRAATGLDLLFPRNSVDHGLV